MRKIISKQEEEKKKKRNQIIVGGILIFVMLLSTLGFAFQNFIISGGSTSGNSTQTVKYNGFTFSQQNNYWVLNTNEGRFVFTNTPSDLNYSGIESLSLNAENFANKTLYLYSGDNLNASSEVRINMKNIAGNIQDACPPGQICSNSVNQTITASCADNFIIIENGTSGVRQDQNCIYISGQGSELIGLIDDVLFKILGVKK